MGCRTSSPIRIEKKNSRIGVEKAEELKRKIARGLKTRDELYKKGPSSLTISKIILKLDKYKKNLRTVKEMFMKLCAPDTTGLSLSQLQDALNDLHVELTTEEIGTLFMFVDVDESKIMEFKEFIVALTIGKVLDIIPGLTDTAEDVSAFVQPATQMSTEPQELDRTTSKFMGEGGSIRRMLDFIIQAYLLFDPDARGHIGKRVVDKMMSENKSKDGASSILSDALWKTMDWDKSGEIDFAEFVITFVTWMDADSVEDADMV